MLKKIIAFFSIATIWLALVYISAVAIPFMIFAAKTFISAELVLVIVIGGIATSVGAVLYTYRESHYDD